MKEKRLFSVNAFAKLSRVTPVMLHHYDKLGLLSPVTRGENNYRYYSIRQLSEIKLIRTMQELGMSLREIKELKERRTPERTAQTLRQQLEKIDEKIGDLNSARRLTLALLEPIQSVSRVREEAISIRRLPAAPIALGDWNEYGPGEDGYDALVTFYEDIGKKYPGADLSYPVWGLFTQENTARKMNGERTYPQRYYFYSPDGRETRPAGLYAVGYARGGYGENNELYIRLRDYIRDSGFEVCGDAYEEYPLNEISVADDTNYLMRVMVTVRRRGARR